MRGDGLCLARLGDHEELRQDGDRLQVDRERPQHLHHAELVVEDQRQQRRGKQQELNAERNVLIYYKCLENEKLLQSAGSKLAYFYCSERVS